MMSVNSPLLRQRLALALPALCLFLLTGCPDTGVVCSQGLSRCGTGCADFTSDRRNCGSCGVSCQAGQVCQQGQCACQEGATLCDGQCVVAASDPTHCGSCTKACAAGEFCEAGACRGACSAGLTACAQGCTDLNTDGAHCGSCGTVCENAQSCHAGHCSYDLVAACFTNGQLTGLQRSTGFKGPAEPLGSGPVALASMRQVLLALDGIDKRLYQAQLASVNGHAFAKLAGAPLTGVYPNHVFVADPYAYVANSGSNTLQVLQVSGTALDAGIDGGDPAEQGADGGLPLTTVAELPLGANSSPFAIAAKGTHLYVVLYGGYGSVGAAGGQKVVEVNVADPLHPVVSDTFNLGTLDLKAFDGGSPVPRPSSIVVHKGNLYLTLNNLNADSYQPEGPGLLAKIDLGTKVVSAIDLGAERCLNPVWLQSDGEQLYVSCAGKANYLLPNYTLDSVEKTGMVLVNALDLPVASWKAACPPGAAPYDPDGGSGCLPVSTGRFAVVNKTVYVADQNGGRVFVLENTGNALTERRGYVSDAGAPIQACSVDPARGLSNVSDVLAVP